MKKLLTIITMMVLLIFPSLLFVSCDTPVNVLAYRFHHEEHEDSTTEVTLTDYSGTVIRLNEDGSAVIFGAPFPARANYVIQGDKITFTFADIEPVVCDYVVSRNEIIYSFEDENGFVISIVLKRVEGAVLTTIRLEGEGMYPTLEAGEHSFKLLLTKEVNRQDIIISEVEMTIYGRTVSHNIISRVIGIAGDKIEFVLDEDCLYYDIFVNDRLLIENYIAERTVAYGSSLVYQVGENEFFAMGDNRQNSYDSRNYGCVSVDGIMGIVTEIIS